MENEPVEVFKFYGKVKELKAFLARLTPVQWEQMKATALNKRETIIQ